MPLDLVIPVSREEDLPHLNWEHHQTFIQWKGTNVCMDWTCPTCGENQHTDGDFCYYLRCCSCGQYCHVGTNVTLTAVTPQLAEQGSFCTGLCDEE
jgi:hypothetical protein